MSAAPLKPRMVSPQPTVESRFPRSNERGPVEARRAPSHNAAPFHHFRARMSAAPLKRDVLAAVRVVRLDFRARMSAAPLKPISHSWNFARRLDFRARMSAAPLKRLNRVLDAAVNPDFRARMSAAPLKRRPGSFSWCGTELISALE